MNKICISPPSSAYQRAVGIVQVCLAVDDSHYQPLRMQLPCFGPVHTSFQPQTTHTDGPTALKPTTH